MLSAGPMRGYSVAVPSSPRSRMALRVCVSTSTIGPMPPMPGDSACRALDRDRLRTAPPTGLGRRKTPTMTGSCNVHGSTDIMSDYARRGTHTIAASYDAALVVPATSAGIVRPITEEEGSEPWPV